MAKTSIPAPVKLQRLYIGLIAVTVAVCIISLASLLRVSHSLQELSSSRASGPARIEEMKLDVTAAVSAIHRLVGDSSAVEPAPLLARHFAAGVPGAGLLSPVERELIAKEMARLEQLAHMARSDMDRQRWEDLQIVLRDADRTADRAVASLDRELARIRQAGTEKGDRLQGILLAMGGLFILTLLASLGIAADLYTTWRRFERSVLGI
ncbi:MAG: hypothetical protein P1S46_09225 [bacterium]|nr:hypothetical protein [bacterium]